MPDRRTDPAAAFVAKPDTKVDWIDVYAAESEFEETIPNTGGDLLRVRQLAIVLTDVARECEVRQRSTALQKYSATSIVIRRVSTDLGTPPGPINAGTYVADGSQQQSPVDTRDLRVFHTASWGERCFGASGLTGHAGVASQRIVGKVTIAERTATRVTGSFDLNTPGDLPLRVSFDAPICAPPAPITVPTTAHCCTL